MGKSRQESPQGGEDQNMSENKEPEINIREAGGVVSDKVDKMSRSFIKAMTIAGFTPAEMMDTMGSGLTMANVLFAPDKPSAMHNLREISLGVRDGIETNFNERTIKELREWLRNGVDQVLSHPLGKVLADSLKSKAD